LNMDATATSLFVTAMELWPISITSKACEVIPTLKKFYVQGLLIPANVSLIASKSEVGAVVFTIRFVDVISHV
jgi:hypothetical protein